MAKTMTIAALTALLGAATTPARAELSAEELAKIAQNPVANLISIPFQNNTNLHFGPQKNTQDVLNIQPVIPFTVNSDWNIITRTIVPVIWMPDLAPTLKAVNGIGDTVFTAWLSPGKPGKWIWGAGPVVQAPTDSDTRLGNRNWGLGSSVVLVHLDHASPWVFGLLANNIWSLSSNQSGGSYNHGVIQPGINYNFKSGLYITSSPVITVDWRAASSQQWTLPLGAGIGKIFRFGKLPVNMSLAGYYNVVSPTNSSDWTIRTQIQFLFPK
jgi:hypothetical protein